MWGVLFSIYISNNYNYIFCSKKIEIINLRKQGRSYTFHAMKLGATSNVKARQNGKQLYILVQFQRQVNLFR